MIPRQTPVWICDVRSLTPWCNADGRGRPESSQSPASSHFLGLIQEEVGSLAKKISSEGVMVGVRWLCAHSHRANHVSWDKRESQPASRGLQHHQQLGSEDGHLALIGKAHNPITVRAATDCCKEQGRQTRDCSWRQEVGVRCSAVATRVNPPPSQPTAISPLEETSKVHGRLCERGSTSASVFPLLTEQCLLGLFSAKQLG